MTFWLDSPCRHLPGPVLGSRDSLQEGPSEQFEGLLLPRWGQQHPKAGAGGCQGAAVLDGRSYRTAAQQGRANLPIKGPGGRAGLAGACGSRLRDIGEACITPACATAPPLTLGPGRMGLFRDRHGGDGPSFGTAPRRSLSVGPSPSGSHSSSGEALWFPTSLDCTSGPVPCAGLTPLAHNDSDTHCWQNGWFISHPAPPRKPPGWHRTVKAQSLLVNPEPS